jgi:hypothetical protein
MTGDSRSDGELLAGLPCQPELMGVLYERHAQAVFRYLARRAGPAAAEGCTARASGRSSHSSGCGAARRTATQ